MIYIGEKVIKEHHEEGNKVLVTFEDDSKAEYTKKMFDALQTLEPQDLTQLQERRVVAFQREMMTLMLEWGFLLSDMETLFSWTNNYVNQKIQAANEKLWGKSFFERTIIDLDNVLTNDKNSAGAIREQNNRASS